MESLSTSVAAEQRLSIDIETVSVSHRSVMRIRGELDLATAPDLFEAVSRVDSGRIDLDVSGVTFCDVVGATAIEQVLQRLRADGSHVIMIGGEGPLARLLTVDGLFPALQASVRIEG